MVHDSTDDDSDEQSKDNAAVLRTDGGEAEQATKESDESDDSDESDESNEAAESEEESESEAESDEESESESEADSEEESTDESEDADDNDAADDGEQTEEESEDQEESADESEDKEESAKEGEEEEAADESEEQEESADESEEDETPEEPATIQADDEAVSEQTGDVGVDPQEDGSTPSLDSNGGGDTASIIQVRNQVIELSTDVIGRGLDGIIEVSRNEDNWRAVVEIIERRSVPDTQDILGQYEIELDEGGEVIGYRRLEKYRRSDTGPSQH